jgi:hypothetical protein
VRRSFRRLALRAARLRREFAVQEFIWDCLTNPKKKISREQFQAISDYLALCRRGKAQGD